MKSLQSGWFRGFAVSLGLGVVFAGPLARGRAEPTNAAVDGGRVLWVDRDDVGHEAQPAWVDVPRPHLLVSSGGGLHAYWLVDR